MSRIGKAPITVPAGVTVDISDSNLVTVKGPKGELKQQIDPDMEISLEEGVISVSRPTEQKRHKALHGLSRALIFNMVEGVSVGYKKELELIGVGYKADARGQLLELNLGYSHNIFFAIPEEVSVNAVTEKGKTKITPITGINRNSIKTIPLPMATPLFFHTN